MPPAGGRLGAWLGNGQPGLIHQVRCIPLDDHGPASVSQHDRNTGRADPYASSEDSTGARTQAQARSVCQACHKRGIGCTFDYVYKKPGRPLG